VKTIKISAVSYTNTRPFVYGLENSAIPQEADISFDVPADCARKLIDGRVDIGLVPVAALLDIPGYELVADYCIGATGPVNSVFIFSDQPMENIHTVKLDPQSRTSNNLARVLLKNHWKKSVEFVHEGEADAFVLIGDRTFGKKNAYAYAYDLAEEWISFTGLPFVFAVWASNKPIEQGFRNRLNQALKYGLDHRAEVIASLPPVVGFDLADYLLNRISYTLDEPKLKALKLFHSYITQLNAANSQTAEVIGRF
jgi:chorismate dehydratase